MNLDILENISDSERNEINKIIELNYSEDGNLISLLQGIQDHYGYIPQNVLFYISEELKISPAEIYSIVTFYTQFKLYPKGKNIIVTCSGTACHIKGAPVILTFIEKFLGIKSGETTKDKLFSLESVACLGCCAISPVCVINRKIFGNLTLKKLRIILNNLLKEENI